MLKVIFSNFGGFENLETEISEFPLPYFVKGLNNVLLITLNNLFLFEGVFKQLEIQNVGIGSFRLAL